MGYFARELGINLQLYQFNADTVRFEPVAGFAPLPAAEIQQPEPELRSNGKVKA